MDWVTVIYLFLFYLTIFCDGIKKIEVIKMLGRLWIVFTGNCDISLKYGEGMNFWSKFYVFFPCIFIFSSIIEVDLGKGTEEEKGMQFLEGWKFCCCYWKWSSFFALNFCCCLALKENGNVDSKTNWVLGILFMLNY